MFKHILLATDGSEAASQPAHRAVELARIHGAQLTAVFVVDPYPYLGIGEVNPMGFQAYLAAAQETATRAFNEIADLAEKAGVQLKTLLVEDAHVAAGILKAAEDVGADLIVVGSHGRSRLEKLMLGSVARKIVDQATRPVLVVR